MKGKHTSLDKALKRNINFLENHFAIKKIILGFSECCRHKYRPGAIKFKTDTDGGIKVNGYSGKGVTDIFILISPIEARNAVKQVIDEKFGA